jgi:hypothetical protein
MSKQRNDEQYPGTINAIEKLALTLHCQRKPGEAISRWQKVVSLRRESEGLDNHRTITSSVTLAFWQFERGQFDDAVSSSTSLQGRYLTESMSRAPIET